MLLLFPDGKQIGQNTLDFMLIYNHSSRGSYYSILWIEGKGFLKSVYQSGTLVERKENNSACIIRKGIYQKSMEYHIHKHTHKHVHIYITYIYIYIVVI